MKKVLAMKKHARSKRYRSAVKHVDRQKYYALAEAVAVLKKISKSGSDPTIELHLTLTDRTIPKTVHLPHGSGKKERVLVFATGEAADAARKAGAFMVGADDLIENIKTNGLPVVDEILTTPEMMPKVVTIANVLGPRGLMPNPKLGTITDNPAATIKERMAGRIELKKEAGAPLLHLAVGKHSLEAKSLEENIQVVLDTLTGKIKRATLAATMSPGIKLQL